MRDFLKMTLAVICGLVIVTVLSTLLCLGVVGSLVSAEKAKVIIPKSGVLALDMSKFTIKEQSQDLDIMSLITSQEEIAVIGLWDAIRTINIAAQDPAIKYIYIKSDNTSIDISHLEEFRAALDAFRKTSGKAIVSYMEAPTTASYYLASVSDKIYMTSHIGATTMLTGVSSQMFFLGDILKNLGVNVQLIRHGKYKSAGEMYTRGSSSAENREQNQRMVDSIWESMSAEIAQSRGISVEDLNAAINGLKLVNPQDFVECKLVDELFDRSGLQEKLATLAVVNSYKDVKFIPFADYVSAKALPNTADKEIAVIYADGEIVDGSAKSEVSGGRFASVIAKVRADSTVKVVVLRVNSPGGSVLASEKIKAELDSLSKVKPLIASYGNYAASGGYWISSCCDKIYSDKTTLTGSIGVFSIIPEVSKLADKLHIGVETISSNSHGDMYSLMRPLESAEQAYLQKTIETVYDRFTDIVSQGRSIPKETVDAIGQGRVWTGADALGINLVDECGTLEDALAYAASVAGDASLSNWNIKGYPKPVTQMEMILDMVGGKTSPTDAMISKLNDLTQPIMLARMDKDIVIR